MTDCPDDATIAAFAEGALLPVEQDRVERHLHACATCRAVAGDVLAAVVDEPVGASAPVADVAASHRPRPRRPPASPTATLVGRA